ncbi:MAG: tail fiber domain-containing protein [Bacteroidota bacterium]|nr:tail fiber domain-containing protein [Bacteroidota bacterium]
MKTTLKLITALVYTLCIYENTTGQTWDLSGNAIAVGDYLGTTNAQPLIIKTQLTQPINFHTTNTQRMTITSAGLVGIGTTNPIHKLDINDGNINLVTFTRGYMISKEFVLWHNGNARNIYVGQSAGNATSSGTNNTFVGNRAGNSNTVGYDNTFTGARSGNSNTTGFRNTFTGMDAGMLNNEGEENTFSGYQAGRFNTIGSRNSFTGVEAGFSNSLGELNTFMGYRSGYSNLIGYKNSFIGNEAGFNNTSGHSNTMLGNIAGRENVSGIENTFLGSQAGYSNISGNQNTFIGVRAGYFTTFGQHNSFIGDGSGYYNTIGEINTFVGYFSGRNMVDGNYNTFIGQSSCSEGLHGNYNTVLGSMAGTNIGISNNDEYNVVLGSDAGQTIEGSYNIVIGKGADAPSGIDYGIAIGTNAVVNHNDKMILGDNNVYVGIGLSNDGTGPQKSLEINARDLSGTVLPDESGLRFRQLTSTSQTIPNPGAGVLSVNTDGDVILVDGGAGSGIGNYCASTSNPLTGNYTIPLDDNNFYFEGNSNGTQSNNVGIGLDCTDLFLGKLHVSSTTSSLSTSGTNAGYFENHDEGLLIAGIKGVIPDNELDGRYFGGIFEANNTYSGSQNFGISGSALAIGNAVNMGGAFYAGGASSANYAIYASASSSGDVAGFFNGDIDGIGNNNYASDQKLKTNITTITGATAIIDQLNPVNFEFKTADYPQMRFNQGNQMGLIAQEAELVLPEIVKQSLFPTQYDASGNITHQEVDYLSVNYEALIPLLIAGSKEQQQTINTQQLEIDDLKAQVTSILNCINNLPPGFGCGSSARFNESGDNGKGSETMSLLNVELSDKNIVVLNQNVPNPFAESTTISYNIPEDVKYAQIIFSDQIGRIIKTVDINEKGQGMINVFASDLSSGIYSYSLIIDGVSVDSKKMVKTK